MMENSKNLDSGNQNSPELPSLIKYISSNEVVGFDNVDESIFVQSSDHQPISPAEVIY